MCNIINITTNKSTVHLSLSLFPFFLKCICLIANPLFVDHEGVWRQGHAVKHQWWLGPLRHTVREVHPCFGSASLKQNNDFPNSITCICFTNQTKITICTKRARRRNLKIPKTHHNIFNENPRTLPSLVFIPSSFLSFGPAWKFGSTSRCRCQLNDHQPLGVVFKTAAVWFPDAKCRSKTPEGFPARILARASSRAFEQREMAR